MSDSKKLHVLVIPSWYPRFEGDISGSFFREQAQALSKSGLDVGVIAPQFLSLLNLKNISFFEKHEKHDDNAVITYLAYFTNFFPKIRTLQRTKMVSAGLKLFERYIAERGVPDVIHVHSLIYGGFLALELKRRYKIPFIVTEHSSSYSRGLVSTGVLDALREVVKGASHCLAVSQEFRYLLNSIWKTEKWTYLPNIVSQDFLAQELELKNKCEREAYQFLNICRLNKNKRVDVLIKAFAGMYSQVKDVELCIGGCGPELDSLVALTSELGITHKVKFLGALSRDEVLKNITKADAFVLSSEYETFGVVLIEALALGKPVIATKCGGPESIVIPEVGYLVEKNSPVLLAEAMMLLYSNRDNYNPNAIRAYCTAKFSEEAVVSRLMHLYHDVVDFR